MENRDAEILKRHYELKPLKYQLLRQRGKRKVWYVQTNKGPFCFKRYNNPFETYQFSFEGQEYLINNGVKIPRLIRNKEGLFYSLGQKGTVYVLFEWISGSYPLKLNKKEHVIRCMESLANFHKRGKGFIPSSPDLELERYRLNTNQEQRMLNELVQLNEKMRNQPPSVRKLIKEHHSWMVERTKAGIDKLQEFMKGGDLQEESKGRYIAHNDFADINVLLTRRDTYLIDFDDLTYNFPTVDVEQIFIKTARHGIISPKDVELWLSSYLKVFPLTKPLKGLLIQRLALPTIYYHLLTRLSNGGRTTPEQLSNTIQWEKGKYRVFSRL
ncbi:phosphotransferase [Microaerobacter geothermalis]|uniref:phosphotransferase n=1 Tax=Microaerobacter geothermalis TaxID=674972 RepID=UPI001F2A5F59|nr:phosphotransferase [Microaerobacter geothermalis]MCF6093321.1 phosphotransferase [Microaerobacter geothermalis]